MTSVGELDVHREQITFDLDTEVRRGRVAGYRGAFRSGSSGSWRGQPSLP